MPQPKASMTVTRAKVALIGAGRMGGAMLRGWTDARLAFDVHVFEPSPMPEVAGLIGAAGWQLNPDPQITGPMDLVVLAVKPQAFKDACNQSLALLCAPATLAVSIMAGTTISTIMAGTTVERVIRAMPNTPGQIGRGITACVRGPEVTDEDQGLVEAMLRPLGKVLWLDNERDVDLATAVSGSGPAYLFLLAESMVAAGEAIGLAPHIAKALALETIYGSAALMEQSGDEPLELRRAVTSPGGTTAAAIDILMAGGGIHMLMRNAIEAATERARQLSRS